MVVDRAAARYRRRVGALIAVVAALLVFPLGVVATADDNPPGLLLSLDPATGREQWRAETPPVFDVADVSREMVVGRGFDCGSGGFRTVAYRARDGRERWHRPASGDGRAFGAETIGRGADRTGVVVVALDREVQGLDVKSGSVRWHVRVPPFSTVEVTADGVYVGVNTSSGEPAVLRALDRRTGHERWSSKTSGPVFQAPVTQAGPNVVVTTVVRANTFPINDEVRVLDARSGRELWTTIEAPRLVSGSVVALYRAATAIAASATVDVRDARTGQPLWQHAADARSVSESSGVVVLDDGTSADAFDARTGEPLWTHPATDSTISVGAGLVVVGTDRNELTALDLRTGAERWGVALPGDALTTTHSVAIGRDGIYVTRGCTPTD